MSKSDQEDFLPTREIQKKSKGGKDKKQAKAYLAILTGPRAGSQYSLPDDRQIVIGRGTDCMISLDDKDVSRRHASLQPFGTDYYIMDMGSTNGILVNGSPEEKKMLKHGDKISIGQQILQFILVGPEGIPL